MPEIRFSEFQRKVYQAVLAIPLGEVRTYGQIAKEIGMPNASRAVAKALKDNPYTIIIPCHRVVAANGIGGYSKGVDEKRKLLELEKRIKEQVYGDYV